MSLDRTPSAASHRGVWLIKLNSTPKSLHAHGVHGWVLTQGLVVEGYTIVYTSCHAASVPRAHTFQIYLSCSPSPLRVQEGTEKDQITRALHSDIMLIFPSRHRDGTSTPITQQGGPPSIGGRPRSSGSSISLSQDQVRNRPLGNRSSTSLGQEVMNLENRGIIRAETRVEGEIDVPEANGMDFQSDDGHGPPYNYGTTC